LNNEQYVYYLFPVQVQSDENCQARFAGEHLSSPLSGQNQKRRPFQGGVFVSVNTNP